MSRYNKRLEGDLVRWREAGWVTPGGEAAIRAELRAAGGGIGFAGVLAMLGAILVGFAVMSFVAANWQEMPRLARLGLLLGSLWACYGLAGLLFQRGLEAFGHAAVLLAASVFGASIMLIAQMYHMDGNPPDAVLVWAAGTLLAGIVLRSNPALALAMLLAALWGGWETVQREQVFWLFLPAWALVAATYWWRQWRPGVHLAGAALSVFVISLGYLLQIAGKEHYGARVVDADITHGIVIAIGLAAMALAAALERLAPKLAHLGPAVFGYGLATAFAGLYALQFIENPETGTLIGLAVLTLALLLAAIYWGARQSSRGLLWLGYALFSAEILTIYFKTIGTLLGSSLFFLVAGLIVSALAALAYRLHVRSDALGVRA